ncbi:unnamed protein product [Didymodactylos carnosus]|uniref:Uncharacterized protein n=1 Tax=Didymodactylos carnosus TaxID=1234261 RepID=A0A816GUD2_9BILA|nr:unnamed protein product [Didymodactylos carnosus]CAF4677343.1 unnamed protein product [Didymodactylos carnosus]
MNWFITLMEFPEKTADGFLTTGSSLATLSAIPMARARLIEGNNYSMVTLYISDESDHCIRKVWSTLGLPLKNIRFISTTRSDFKMNVDDLKRVLEIDLTNNFIPLCIVGSQL